MIFKIVGKYPQKTLSHHYHMASLSMTYNREHTASGWRLGEETNLPRLISLFRVVSPLYFSKKIKEIKTIYPTS